MIGLLFELLDSTTVIVEPWLVPSCLNTKYSDRHPKMNNTQQHVIQEGYWTLIIKDITPQQLRDVTNTISVS
jgi:hypothetical protein